jgi:hypothetical protein
VLARVGIEPPETILKTSLTRGMPHDEAVRSASRLVGADHRGAAERLGGQDRRL